MTFFKTLLVSILTISLFFISCSSDSSDDTDISEVTEQNDDTSNDNDTSNDQQQGDDNQEENDDQQGDDNQQEDQNEEQEDEQDEEQPTGDLLASGSFETTSEYTISGNFEIIENEQSRYIIVDDAFFVEGQLPDVVIYLSNSTTSQENATLISEDVEDDGSQFFEIPEELSLSDYTYVLLYCRDFDQDLGAGAIN